jgi:esterase/lipase superfamily enzyme
MFRRTKIHWLVLFLVLLLKIPSAALFHRTAVRSTRKNIPRSEPTSTGIQQESPCWTENTMCPFLPARNTLDAAWSPPALGSLQIENNVPFEFSYSLSEMGYGSPILASSAFSDSETQPNGSVAPGPNRSASNPNESAAYMSRERVVRDPESGAEYYCRSLLFVTDRKPSGSTKPEEWFTGDPNVDLIYGQCEVSLPLDHAIGQLESPSIWKLEFVPDLRKHSVLLNVTATPKSDFFDAASEQVTQSERKQAFVFIHGFNVSFESATRRAAQIAHDLKFDGASILYSWPSKGRFDGYLHDSETVRTTVPHLVKFLSDLGDATGARVIHLIAHSMGNRALAAALGQLKEVGTPRPFRQIILAAPDINTLEFRQLADAIRARGERVTIYVSPRDKALWASRALNQFRRIGEDITVIPGIDTIDASRVDTSFLYHSYFAHSRSVMSDIASLIVDGRHPRKRFGIREVTDAIRGTYYAMEA